MLYGDGDTVNDIQAAADNEQSWNVAGLATAPIGGFIWGAIVGAIVGPSGGRGSAAVDAGVWGAVASFAQKLVCMPASMEGMCRVVGALPITTGVAGYIGYQHRTGARG